MHFTEAHLFPEPAPSIAAHALDAELAVEHDAYLVAQSLAKEYQLKNGRALLAISDVSFSVQKNQICTLLGPSGCGKSTVLRMIAGLESITSGAITLAGKAVSQPGKERGMVFQQYTSFPWLTVQENVEYGLKIQGRSRKQRAQIASHFIEQVKLNKFRDAYPGQLSGGMQQRVAIARTLANQPEIVLMDEPFAALDAETRWQMQELLLSLVKDEHLTVILVTHDIDEALFLGDQIIFFSCQPGTVRQRFYPDWQQVCASRQKEEMHGTQMYIELEKQLMQMMRQEAGAVKHV
jgi:NitT/TauT family transport system ATP-binding protein